MTHQEIMFYIDPWTFLSDVALNVPDPLRQLSRDIHRCDVRINNSIRVKTVDDLLSRISPSYHDDITLLCTQASIGSVVVNIQHNIFPCIIAELERGQPQYSGVKINIETCPQGTVSRLDICKSLRIVRINEENGNVKNMALFSIDMTFFFALNEGASVCIRNKSVI